MQKKTTQRITVIFGILMASLMALSAILPLISPPVPVPTPEPPTPTPAPTFPAPITNFDAISFTTQYLHPNGQFVVAMPSGWQPTQPNNNGVQAQSNFNNSEAVSVIEASIEELSAPIATLDELSARYNTSSLAASWARYTGGWSEIARQVDTENNRVLMDFEARRGGQTFLARQQVWTQANHIYSIRVVVPNNARDLLFFLVEQLPPTLRVLPQFAETPLGWNSTYDSVSQHILRFPNVWQVTDSAPGLPVSIEGADAGVSIRVETRTETVADEAAATALVEALRPGTTVASVQPVTREGAEGFAIAYNFRNADGAGLSGLAVLLNGTDGRLHLANAVLDEAGIDLNSAEAQATYTELTNAMGTFSLLEIPNLYLDPSAFPTVPPIIELTAEATEPVAAGEATPETDMTEAATAEAATPEATDSAEAETDATPEATEAGG